MQAPASVTTICVVERAGDEAAEARVQLKEQRAVFFGEHKKVLNVSARFSNKPRKQCPTKTKRHKTMLRCACVQPALLNLPPSEVAIVYT